MKSFIDYLLITESFKDAAVKWKKPYADSPDAQAQVDQYIERFKVLKAKKQISGKENDIGYWIPKGFSEFQQFVRSATEAHEEKQMEKEKEKNVIKVFENDKVTVYDIRSYEASCKYGAGTKWCITQRTDQHWRNYFEKNKVTFYFAIPKEGSNDPEDIFSKVAFAIYQDGSREVFDAADSSMNDRLINKFLTVYDIPEDIFKPREVITFAMSIKDLSDEEKIKKINERWVSAVGEQLVWNDTYTRAKVESASSLDSFIDAYGNETAKYIMSIFNGDEHYDIYEVYDGNVEDCFNMLDDTKVTAYLQGNYPDDEEEWDGNEFEFLKDQSDELYDACQSAARDGEERGAENDMMDYLKKGDIKIKDSGGYETDFEARILDGIWEEPLKLYATYTDILHMLDEDFIEELENGIGFEFNVEQPYNGFSGWDEEAAKEYFSNNTEFGEMVK